MGRAAGPGAGGLWEAPLLPSCAGSGSPGTGLCLSLFPPQKQDLGSRRWAWEVMVCHLRGSAFPGAPLLLLNFWGSWETHQSPRFQKQMEDLRFGIFWGQVTSINVKATDHWSRLPVSAPWVFP